MKKITINDKEYDIDCNAYTRFLYKKVFGNGIFKDLEKLNNLHLLQEKVRKELKDKKPEEIEEEINRVTLSNLDDFMDAVLQIAYILILTANPKTETFENWLKSIAEINLSDSWIDEVTETAVNSFLR